MGEGQADAWRTVSLSFSYLLLHLSGSFIPSLCLFWLLFGPCFDFKQHLLPFSLWPIALHLHFTKAHFDSLAKPNQLILRCLEDGSYMHFSVLTLPDQLCQPNRMLVHSWPLLHSTFSSPKHCYPSFCSLFLSFFPFQICFPAWPLFLSPDDQLDFQN